MRTPPRRRRTWQRPSRRCWPTALSRRPAASLVVSGGATPYPMYAQLAQHKLDWSRVQITLADERWVATDHADSNERRVRASLLRHGAAAARFIGLKNEATPARRRRRGRLGGAGRGATAV